MRIRIVTEGASDDGRGRGWGHTLTAKREPASEGHGVSVRPRGVHGARRPAPSPRRLGEAAPKADIPKDCEGWLAVVGFQ
jgi:hypothetical protein